MGRDVVKAANYRFRGWKPTVWQWEMVSYCVPSAIPVPRGISFLSGVALRPLLGLGDGGLLVLLPRLRNVVGERVVGVRRREERLDREQDRADLERGRPLVLENVEADAAELVCKR